MITRSFGTHGPEVSAIGLIPTSMQRSLASGS